MTKTSKHDAVEVMLRVKSKKNVRSDADRAIGEHILPAGETLPQHTRSKPSHRCPVIPVGARVQAKFQGDGLWYAGRVGIVYGTDEEVSYDIVFDDEDKADLARWEHVRLLEQQVLLNVST